GVLEAVAREALLRPLQRAPLLRRVRQARAVAVGQPPERVHHLRAIHALGADARHGVLVDALLRARDQREGEEAQQGESERTHVDPRDRQGTARTGGGRGQGTSFYLGLPGGEVRELSKSPAGFQPPGTLDCPSWRWSSRPEPTPARIELDSLAR